MLAVLGLRLSKAVVAFKVRGPWGIPCGGSVFLMLRQIIRYVEPGCLAANEDMSRGLDLWVCVQRAQGETQYIWIGVEFREKARPVGAG